MALVVYLVGTTIGCGGGGVQPLYLVVTLWATDTQGHRNPLAHYTPADTLIGPFKVPSSAQQIPFKVPSRCAKDTRARLRGTL